MFISVKKGKTVAVLKIICYKSSAFQNDAAFMKLNCVIVSWTFREHCKIHSYIQKNVFAKNGGGHEIRRKQASKNTEGKKIDNR